MMAFHVLVFYPTTNSQSYGINFEHRLKAPSGSAQIRPKLLIIAAQAWLLDFLCLLPLNLPRRIQVLKETRLRVRIATNSRASRSENTSLTYDTWERWFTFFDQKIEWRPLRSGRLRIAETASLLVERIAFVVGRNPKRLLSIQQKSENQFSAAVPLQEQRKVPLQ